MELADTRYVPGAMRRENESSAAPQSTSALNELPASRSANERRTLVSVGASAQWAAAPRGPPFSVSLPDTAAVFSAMLAGPAPATRGAAAAKVPLGSFDASS